LSIKEQSKVEWDVCFPEKKRTVDIVFLSSMNAHMYNETSAREKNGHEDFAVSEVSPQPLFQPGYLTDGAQ